MQIKSCHVSDIKGVSSILVSKYNLSFIINLLEVIPYTFHATSCTFKLSIYWYFSLICSSILFVKAVRQIRAMGARSKIIGLTAFITEKDEQDFFAAGIDEFFEKPLDPDWFVPIIREVDNQI